MSPKVAVLQSINGLKPSTEYAIYFVAKGASGLFQSSIQRTIFSTSVVPSITLRRTGQTFSIRAGDDGSVQSGVSWPTPRFKDIGDGTVVDNLTGIVWAKNANCFGPKTWTDALLLAKNLASGQCGLTDGSKPGDWRLPNKREMISLFDFVEGMHIRNIFTNNQYGQAWTSTTVLYDKTTAWLGVVGTGGDMARVTKNTALDGYLVWPIKVKRSGGIINLPATGQNSCFDGSGNTIDCQGTGQDGEIRAGVLWDDGRFQINQDCVNDSFTGLLWAKDANLPKMAVHWENAMDFIESINKGEGLCGFHDWRLPNILELESLNNSEFGDTSSWLLTQGFKNVQAAGYWSSTASGKSGAGTAIMGMGAGSVGSSLTRDANDFYVWPVRGGR